MPEKMLEKECFIIMPVTTQSDMISAYNGDKDHFKHVMENLFVPANKEAGFKPIKTIAKGFSFF